MGADKPAGGDVGNKATRIADGHGSRVVVRADRVQRRPRGEAHRVAQAGKHIEKKGKEESENTDESAMRLLRQAVGRRVHAAMKAHVPKVRAGSC